MKVVGIVGSPCRGEATDTLVREVLAGAEEAGAEVEAFTDRLFALLAPGFERRLGEEGRPAVFVVTQGADDESLFAPVVDKMTEAFCLAGLPVGRTLLAAAVEGREGMLSRPELPEEARRAGRDLLE